MKLNRVNFHNALCPIEDVADDITFSLATEHNPIPYFDGLVHIAHETWEHYEALKPMLQTFKSYILLMFKFGAKQLGLMGYLEIIRRISNIVDRPMNDQAVNSTV